MFSQNTKILILISVSFCILVFGALAYSLYTIQVEGSGLKDKSQMLANQDKQAEARRELEKSAEETQSEREQLQEVFISSDEETVDLLSELDQLAASYNLDLDTNKIEVKENDESDNFKFLEVTLNTEGGTSQTSSFIEALENLPYHSFVESVDLNYRISEETGNETAQSTFVLNLTAENI